jgi:hypothetical protein
MPFRECSQGKLAGGVSGQVRGIVRPLIKLMIASSTLLAASCGDQEAQREDRLSLLSSKAVERPIGPQERAAAPALAVYTADEPDEQDPYARALDCASSISATNKKLANSPLIGADQLAALAQAEKLFEARVRRVGSDSGRSATQASADLTSARDQALEDSGRAGRTAIACIRSLGAESGQGTAPQG